MSWSSWVAGAFDVIIARFDEQDPDFSTLIEIWQHLRREGSLPSNWLYTPYTVLLPANRTTTSSSFAAIANSGINHTFSKTNAIIKASNFATNNSGSNIVTVENRLNALQAATVLDWQMFGAAGQVGSISNIFSGYSLGVSLPISLYWKTAAGTATMFANSKLLWEIWEYD